MSPGTHSIRVVLYCGDLDDTRLTNIIGPYPTAQARDHDLRRLAALPGNHGDGQFTASSIDPSKAHHRCTPEQVADIKHFNQVVGALYGYRVGDDGEEITPEPAGELDGQESLFDWCDTIRGRHD